MSNRYVSRRNPLPLPPIEHEEQFHTPISWKGCHAGWEDTVCTNCRLNMQHTLASIRWDCHLIGPLKPQHSLDLSLSAIYKHGPEDFPEKSDIIRQFETVGLPTWRLLKNKRHDPSLIPINISDLNTGHRRIPYQFGESKKDRMASSLEHAIGIKRNVDPTHPLQYGGLTERRSPFNVKLGISSYHSPQSNNGYSRNSYGAFYTS